MNGNPLNLTFSPGVICKIRFPYPIESSRNNISRFRKRINNTSTITLRFFFYHPRSHVHRQAENTSGLISVVEHDYACGLAIGFTSTPRSRVHRVKNTLKLKKILVVPWKQVRRTYVWDANRSFFRPSRTRRPISRSPNVSLRRPKPTCTELGIGGRIPCIGLNTPKYDLQTMYLKTNNQ